MVTAMVKQQKTKINICGRFQLLMMTLFVLLNLTGCNEEEAKRQREYLASNERIAAVNAASNVDAAVKAANVKADADIKIAEINFMERSKAEIQRLASEASTEVKRLETKLGIEKIQQESSIAKTQLWQPVALIACSGTFVLGLVLICGRILISIVRERTKQIVFCGLPVEERVKFVNENLINRGTPPYISNASFKRLEKQASIH